MRNIRLTLSYEGTEFFGWQRQPNVPTVQGCVESAIEKIVAERVTLYGSGRTDAGVHALNQVANFKTASSIPADGLTKALNNLLPSTVRVRSACDAAESFHARHDARCKTYRYRILGAPIASPFLARFVHHLPYPLDHQRMAAAARQLEGEHDFTSFAGSANQVREPFLTEKVDDRADGVDAPCEPDSRQPTTDSRSNVRTIFSSRILWRPRTSILVYEVCGSGFLHHMVRNLVGTLIEVGRGKLAPRDVLEILAARDRTRAGLTAPASGLILVQVEY